MLFHISSTTSSSSNGGPSPIPLRLLPLLCSLANQGADCTEGGLQSIGGTEEWQSWDVRGSDSCASIGVQVPLRKWMDRERERDIYIYINTALNPPKLAWQNMPPALLDLIHKSPDFSPAQTHRGHLARHRHTRDADAQLSEPQQQYPEK